MLYYIIYLFILYYLILLDKLLVIIDVSSIVL